MCLLNEFNEKRHGVYGIEVLRLRVRRYPFHEQKEEEAYDVEDRRFGPTPVLESVNDSARETDTVYVIGSEWDRNVPNNNLGGIPTSLLRVSPIR